MKQLAIRNLAEEQQAIKKNKYIVTNTHRNVTSHKQLRPTERANSSQMKELLNEYYQQESP
jgi:hypothetical protein